jgi:phage shock protein E
MKTISSVLIASSIVLFSFTTNGGKVASTYTLLQQTPVVTNDTPKEFQSAIDKGNCILLDVRTACEVAKGKRNGSINIDWFDDNFQQLAKAQLDKNKTILIYCASGGRSEEASTLLATLGYTHVHNLLGGFTGWKAAGMPVEK